MTPPNWPSGSLFSSEDLLDLDSQYKFIRDNAGPLPEIDFSESHDDFAAVLPIYIRLAECSTRFRLLSPHNTFNTYMLIFTIVFSPYRANHTTLVISGGIRILQTTSGCPLHQLIGSHCRHSRIITSRYPTRREQGQKSSKV